MKIKLRRFQGKEIYETYKFMKIFYRIIFNIEF